jgi:hypothetical protein
LINVVADWARPLIRQVLAQPSGEVFLATAVALEFEMTLARGDGDGYDSGDGEATAEDGRGSGSDADEDVQWLSEEEVWEAWEAATKTRGGAVSASAIGAQPAPGRKAAGFRETLAALARSLRAEDARGGGSSGAAAVAAVAGAAAEAVRCAFRRHSRCSFPRGIDGGAISVRSIFASRPAIPVAR